jgi:hypothetical protein
MKMRVAVSLSAKLRDEQRHRCHQHDAQTGSFAQPFQKSTPSAWRRMLQALSLMVNLSPTVG